MSSRSKHRTTANLIGLIATTTLLIGAFTWAYQNYSTTTSTTTEQEEEEPVSLPLSLSLLVYSLD